ncbi:MAG TPA: hypothetical protein VMY69_06375 [Phycisphaerae bacterium]|nr:hypothetical protein [Phycisphaerae bacterium]
MAESLTLAEALAADAERFAVAREVLIQAYKELLAKRPDGPTVPVGAIGADRWGPMCLPPGAVENWKETLSDEDARTLQMIVERLKFDKKAVALHALAISRLRRLKMKIGRVGTVAEAAARMKTAEAALAAAWPALTEAQKKVVAAGEKCERVRRDYQSACMLEGDLTLLRSRFSEILPAD